MNAEFLKQLAATGIAIANAVVPTAEPTMIAAAKALDLINQAKDLFNDAPPELEEARAALEHRVNLHVDKTAAQLRGRAAQLGAGGEA